MFGIDITVLALAALVAISAAALAYGLLFSRIESEKKAEGRVRRISAAETDRAKVKAARDRVSELSKRRKSVQDSLKELEKKQQERSTRAAPALMRSTSTSTASRATSRDLSRRTAGRGSRARDAAHR